MDGYFMFTFEALHNQQYGVWKLFHPVLWALQGLKRCALKWEGPLEDIGRAWVWKVACRMSSFLCSLALRTCDLWLDLHADFSKLEVTLPLNGLFSIDEIHGILVGKNFQGIDMVLPFICGWVYRVNIYIEHADLKKANILYFNLMFYLDPKSSKSRMCFTVWMWSCKGRVRDLGRRTVNFFKAYWKSGLFTTMFHLLDHLC